MKRTPTYQTGISSRLHNLRQETLTSIIDLLHRHKDDEMDISDLGWSPIIFEDNYDADFSFTMDSICPTEDGKDIEICASSCYSNWTGTSVSLSLDTLVRILDFLEQNEELIFKPEKI